MNVLVSAEVHDAILCVRRNPEWTAKPTDCSDTLGSLQALRDALSCCHDGAAFSCSDLFRPFLKVVRSSQTSGPFTGFAIMALQRLLDLEAVVPGHCDFREAMAELVETVTQCQFEATDPEADELVLIQILQVLVSCLKCRAGAVVSYSLLKQMMQTCLLLAGESAGTVTETSAIVQQIGRQSLRTLVKTVFTCAARHLQNKRCAEETIAEDCTLDRALQLFEFLCSNIGDTNSLPAEPWTRVRCLQMLYIALESSHHAAHLSQPWVAIIQDDLCHGLLQSFRYALNGVLPSNSASTAGIAATRDQSSVESLTASLKLLRLLWLSAGLRSRLGMQMDSLFSTVFCRVLKNPNLLHSHHTEWRIILESLSDILSAPATAVDLYVNFDCHLERDDIINTILQSLSTIVSAQKTGDDWISARKLVLSTLVSGMRGLHGYCIQHGAGCQAPHTGDIRRFNAAALSHQRALKIELREALGEFNKSGKRGLIQLQVLRGAAMLCLSDDMLICWLIADNRCFENPSSFLRSCKIAACSSRTFGQSSRRFFPGRTRCVGRKGSSA
jgi:brefeldin A-resistance guanine nucleotide exchange factor 1